MEFRLGSIPVKVHGAFFITAVLLSTGFGSTFDARAIASTAVIVVVMFVSILIHELGHALTGRAFGLTPRIDLHGMGGTTSWPDGRKVGWGKSMVISAAGPLVGIVFGGAAFLAAAFLGAPAEGSLQLLALKAFINISAIWGIFNLAPMLPLDGGNIMLAFFQLVTKGRGEKAARYISMAVCVVGIAWGLRAGNTWIAVLCGLFLFRNFQGLRQGERVRAEMDLYERLKEGFAALQRQDGPAAIEHAEVVLEHTGAAELRFEALRLLARARILEGQWGALMALIERCRLELGPSELEQFEKAAVELDRPEEARRIRELRVQPAAVAGFRA
jgi:Zn-dependent protease